MDKYLRPTKLDVDPAENNAYQEWDHWRRTFCSFVADLEKAYFQQDTSLHKHYTYYRWKEFSLDILINHVSARIYSYIKHAKNMREAIEILDGVYKSNNRLIVRNVNEAEKVKNSKEAKKRSGSMNKNGEITTNNVIASLFTDHNINNILVLFNTVLEDANLSDFKPLIRSGIIQLVNMLRNVKQVDYLNQDNTFNLTGLVNLFIKEKDSSELYQMLINNCTNVTKILTDEREPSSIEADSDSSPNDINCKDCARTHEKYISKLRIYLLNNYFQEIDGLLPKKRDGLHPVTLLNLDEVCLLRDAAKNHLNFSNIHITTIRGLLRQDKDDEDNMVPWKIVKEGSNYLLNAYKLIKKYAIIMTRMLNIPWDFEMEIVKDILIALQFDPNHLRVNDQTEAFSRQFQLYVSKGENSIYHRMLHSPTKNDVNMFLIMADLFIDTPINQFLEVIENFLQSAQSLAPN